MPNHLINENSPYLLQHANNPVDWYPWGSEALAKAQVEDKPIFLSIGYAACHWCHVMAHESFEDSDISAILNQFFVNIKVDREERPDLDSIYIQTVVAMTGQGGWPLSVFLTPDGKPFYGGTYFPPARRFNLPSFREVLITISDLWRDDRSILLESSNRIADYLQYRPMKNMSKTQLDVEKLKQATANLAQTYNWEYGGWGKAPKFPQPMVIEYLLQQSTRGDKSAIGMAIHVLHAMAKGGMYDIVGGGFARYSTDDLWRIPHFEKMLYDNSQLALVYLHAWLITKEPKFRRVCEETLDFLIREMNHQLGGFYSSLDADTDGEEGKFYVWTLSEIQAALETIDDINFFTAAYDISTSGNFGGKNVLQRSMDDEQIAQKFNVPVTLVPDILSKLHKRLLKARSMRVRPATDEKILTAWNGMAMKAFAEAGRYLDRDDYRVVAQRNAQFLLEYSYQNDRLIRSWRKGIIGDSTGQNAFLEDYAALILGLLSLYQTDFNNKWYKTAIDLANEMIDHFADINESGNISGFFDTRDDHEKLLLRPKDMQDNATPSGNALAATALLQLAAFEGRNEWRKLAEDMLMEVQETIVRHPNAYAQWLCALDYAIGPLDEIAIIGESHAPGTSTLYHALWKEYRPRQAVASSNFPPQAGSPRLLMDRPLKNDMPTAYVCRDFVCLSPTNSAQEMTSKLAG